MYELEDILSLDNAARMLKRSPVTLRWAAQTGRLSAKRVGRDWVTTRDAVLWYEAFHKRDFSRRPAEPVKPGETLGLQNY